MTSQTPQKHRPRIVVVGSVNMDLVVRSVRLPRPGETVMGTALLEVPGGKGANQAVAAARLGAEVALIGRVGEDDFGRRLRAGLEKEGIDINHLAVTPHCPSGLAVVAVEDSGENSITVIPGANERLSADDVLAASHLIRDADILLVQLEVPLGPVLCAIEMARQHATFVILDPAPVPATFPAELLAVDLVCPNETEAAALTGVPIANLDDAKRAALALKRSGARSAVITLGEQGALFCGPDGCCERCVSFKTNIVDTTGAGDAFRAALGVGLAYGRAMPEAVCHACAAGSLAASRPGAQPAMPTAEEVFALVASCCE